MCFSSLINFFFIIIHFIYFSIMRLIVFVFLIINFREMNVRNLNIYQNQNGHLHQQLPDIKMFLKFGELNSRVFMILNLLSTVLVMVFIFNFKVMMITLINIWVMPKSSIFRSQPNKKVLSQIGFFKDFMKVMFRVHMIKTFHFHLSYIFHHCLLCQSLNWMNGELSGTARGKMRIVIVLLMNSSLKKIRL